MPFKLILRRCEVVFLMSGVRMLHFFERLMEIHSNLPILYYGFKKLHANHGRSSFHIFFVCKNVVTMVTPCLTNMKIICLADRNLCIIMSSSLIWIVWNLKEEVLSTKILPWQRLVQQTQEVHLTHLHLKSLYVNQLSFESNENCESSTPNIWAKLWLAVTMAMPCQTNKKENMSST